ncbi:MAG TPA: biotin--[acetyl-CoA-carboxylase] ligase [Methylomirabilota bacterium]|nr:biotin--[acetyl-CoA-carboxylase] ligase [Methylomirabilota bacterium]
MRVAAPAPVVVRLGRVESTQTIAFALAADGAADGTVVVADSQAAGRGRRGRAWVDEPGASLLASIVLRPRLDPVRLPGLSLAAAVAVAEALTRTAGLTPRLKWPNDVLVGGRKIAGILLESRVTGEQATTIIGVGVNLAQRVFPADLAQRATSVWLASGRVVDRDSLLAALLDALAEWRRRLERQGFAPVRTRWRALADTLGRPVTVDGVSGVAVDVDADGALVVADTDGRRRRVMAGEVAQ